MEKFISYDILTIMNRYSPEAEVAQRGLWQELQDLRVMPVVDEIVGRTLEYPWDDADWSGSQQEGRSRGDLQVAFRIPRVAEALRGSGIKPDTSAIFGIQFARLVTSQGGIDFFKL